MNGLRNRWAQFQFPYTCVRSKHLLFVWYFLPFPSCSFLDLWPSICVRVCKRNSSPFWSISNHCLDVCVHSSLHAHVTLGRQNAINAHNFPVRLIHAERERETRTELMFNVSGNFIIAKPGVSKSFVSCPLQFWFQYVCPFFRIHSNFACPHHFQCNSMILILLLSFFL